MKNFINTIKNIYKIEELRTRILNTLGFLLIYRLGSFIVIPGVDSAALEAANGAPTGLAGLIDVFAGGAFSRASIFALGVMPYISASIVMQLMGLAVPHFQKLQKEGESGRKKINQYTRFLTVVVTLLQAPGYIASQIPAVARVHNDTMFWIASILILLSGTIFIMWLGEKITDKGVGNGISLIIMIGIIANLPVSFVQEFVARLENSGGGLVILLVELVVLFLIIVFSVILIQGTRKIPVQFAKKVVGNKQYGGVRQYIPLKVNAAGVMPIIFAQAIMFVPITIAGFSTTSAPGGFVAALSDYTGFWYNFVFAVMIIAFTYFYTAITINPNQMADDMKRNGGFIPGVKPGKDTADFIDTIMSKITLPGSVFLALIAIIPAFGNKFGLNAQFSQFYGGTSLLIMVGVVLDTLQQIESYLLMRHYDGLMKNGRIKGRNTPSAVSMTTNI
ncbi:MAG: preprotein translocase subunit SecY [Bacteroidia bacterium]|nr:preprotein translocase subunit SecY [Bacteroidia bacterium]MCZ2247757.1 preprotein translocase subunit SecY [Bacteroidia bacterium]